MMEVSRIYPTVINVFQRIGGVCQIFIFVFVYLMIYNNEVMIELYFLNFGVLMNPLKRKDDGSKGKNQVADVSMKKSLGNIPSYTYGEVFCFKLFSCCNNRTAKYKQYLSHKKIIEERMDIVNFISSQGYAMLLTKLLIKPHQFKMISHLKATNQESQEKLLALPIDQALQQLNRRE